MDLIRKACQLLRDTETDMRRLIEAAVAEGRYTDVVRLAEITELVGKAASRFNPEAQGEISAVLPPIEADAQTRKAPNEVAELPKGKSSDKPIRRLDLSAFPKFETDGNRLVKIGWSKRDKAAYEHRALKELVLAVSLHLAKVSAGLIFKMDDIVPITLSDGTDVPLYQAYLVLAWLRGIGLVEKKGKDGYRWNVESFDDTAFKTAWEATPRRK